MSLDSQNNSIQDYLYSAFYDTGVAKQLYRKLRFWNRFIYCRNVIYLTYGKISTWSHNNTYLCALSVRHRFTYRTIRFAALSKRNVHWVALKHKLNMWTLAHFYYVDIGTYCCVFITLLQKRIALVQNSNIWGLSLKVSSNMPYTKHNPKPTW